IFGDAEILVYPWFSFPYDPLTGKEQYYFKTAFGWNHLPSLYRVGENSLEEQIEGYIIKKMPECVIKDWNETFDLFTVKTKNPRAEVIFGNRNTKVIFSWIVNIEDKDKRQGVLEHFQTSIPVRLATIHSFVQSIIDKDVSNIKFDIIQNDSDFRMFIDRNYQGGDIVRILDPQSKLKGKDYEVRFARQNRPPALFMIDQNNISSDAYLLGTCEGAEISWSGNSLDITTDNASCNVNLSIQAIALDPDEDPVTYTASGPTGLPFVLSSQITSTPTVCLPYKISATDGEKADWQIVNLRLKSTRIVTTCKD
ncbi:hypothetical protein ACFLZN_01215, partial [Nanoarchaeota archaeon]